MRKMSRELNGFRGSRNEALPMQDTYFTEKIDAFNETLLGYAMHRKMLKKAGRVKY